jgi:hypothetical protein
MSKHTGRINRHEKIAQILLSGDVVSPDEIRACFKGTEQEKVIYRLPTNIYNIKKDGGIIRVHKNGRNVVGYQLVNPQCFSPEGRYVGASATTTATTVEVEIETDKEVVNA